jgi:hypothetical protein
MRETDFQHQEEDSIDIMIKNDKRLKSVKITDDGLTKVRDC